MFFVVLVYLSFFPLNYEGSAKKGEENCPAGSCECFLNVGKPFIVCLGKSICLVKHKWHFLCSVYEINFQLKIIIILNFNVLVIISKIKHFSEF